MAHKGIDQRAPALFQTHRHALAGILGLQLGQPVGQGLRLMFNHPMAALARGQIPEPDVMLLRRPVEPDQRRVFFRPCRLYLVHLVLLPLDLSSGTREPTIIESLIAEA